MAEVGGDMDAGIDEDYCSCGMSLKYLTSAGKKAHYLATAEVVSQHEGFYMWNLVTVMQVDDE